MNAGRTARERARAELAAEIKDEARRQLAAAGPNALSLRAVARALGMVSSALYRYFPNRDELLTALIVDAYLALGESAEHAAAQWREPLQRWCAACRAVRVWARENPHEYALIYGSPVPGYQAPEDTVSPASRVAIALVDTVRAGHAEGRVRSTGTAPEFPATLDRQLADLAKRIAPELPADVLARTLIAWTQLFGMVSFELFGHLAGSVDPSDEFFEHAVSRMAEFVGFDTPHYPRSAAGRTAE